MTMRHRGNMLHLQRGEQMNHHSSRDRLMTHWRSRGRSRAVSNSDPLTDSDPHRFVTVTLGTSGL